MTTYFEAVQRLVYLLAPLLVLATAILPIRVGLADFVVHFVPYVTLGAAANVLLGRGLYRPLETERFNMLKMATFLKAATTLVGCAPTGFTVTPKAASADTRAIRQLLRPYDVLCVLTGVAMALGALRLLGVLGGTGGHADALITAEGWALYNLWVLVHGIRAAARHTTRRATYRFAAHLPVTVRLGERNLSGVTTDLHQGGVSLLLSAALAPGTRVPLLIHLPQETAVGTLHVRSQRPAGSGNTAALWCNGGLFTPSSAGDTNAINAYLIALMPGQLQAAPAPQTVEPVAYPGRTAA
jgi:cellulose synthase (UDP-forming)